MAHLKGNKVSQFGHKQQSLRRSAAFPGGRGGGEVALKSVLCSVLIILPSPGTLVSPSPAIMLSWIISSFLLKTVAETTGRAQ